MRQIWLVGCLGCAEQTPAGPPCPPLPAAPLSTTQLDAPRGYHDVAFDPHGNILGSDTLSLLQVSYEGEVHVFVPGAGVVQGMDWLPGGDLAYADDYGSVFRATPEGQVSLLAGASGGYGVYGVTLGPDDRLYVATWTTIERYDLDTGERVTVLDDPEISPYVLDFSPDGHKMYVGTIWDGGRIWALDLDEGHEVKGRPELFATVGDQEKKLHDALGVDECGNLYVAEFYANNLYRISPTGDSSLFWDYSETSYGHGLEWGSGLGGWRQDALYVPQPYDGNRVTEIVIGVRSREG
jgi:WD40 repeat protein